MQQSIESTHRFLLRTSIGTIRRRFCFGIVLLQNHHFSRSLFLLHISNDNISQWRSSKCVCVCVFSNENNFQFFFLFRVFHQFKTKTLMTYSTQPHHTYSPQTVNRQLTQRRKSSLKWPLIDLSTKAMTSQQTPSIAKCFVSQSKSKRSFQHFWLFRALQTIN